VRLWSGLLPVPGLDVDPVLSACAQCSKHFWSYDEQLVCGACLDDIGWEMVVASDGLRSITRRKDDSQ